MHKNMTKINGTPREIPQTRNIFSGYAPGLTLYLFFCIGPRHKCKGSTHLHSHLRCIVVCFLFRILQKVA